MAGKLRCPACGQSDDLALYAQETVEYVPRSRLWEQTGEMGRPRLQCRSCGKVTTVRRKIDVLTELLDSLET